MHICPSVINLRFSLTSRRYESGAVCEYKHSSQAAIPTRSVQAVSSMADGCVRTPVTRRPHARGFSEFEARRRGLLQGLHAVTRTPPSRWKRKCKCTARGFTLLELLVVIAIIGVLASYIGPRYFSQVGKSQVQTARLQIDAFQKAIEAYRLDVGNVPSTEQALAVLVDKPGAAARWSGPYLNGSVPSDPWGNPYRYRAPGDGGRDYDVWSLGRDGRPGGSGDDADIGLPK